MLIFIIRRPLFYISCEIQRLAIATANKGSTKTVLFQQFSVYVSEKKYVHRRQYRIIHFQYLLRLWTCSYSLQHFCNIQG